MDGKGRSKVVLGFGLPDSTRVAEGRYVPHGFLIVFSNRALHLSFLQQSFTATHPRSLEVRSSLYFETVSQFAQLFCRSLLLAIS